MDKKPEKIVASYHGIPQSYFKKGDPYHCHCHKTTRLVAAQLGWEDGFVATTRLFLGWALALLLVYGAFLLIVDQNFVNVVYSFTNFTTFFTFAWFVNWDIDRRARATFAATLALEAERAKTEEMLHNVLPEEVAARLRKGEVVADSFGDVSVIFVDIVGFSKLARKLSPGHLVKMLNAVFSIADECASRHGVEKVKTIGDAYLAVVGGTSSAAKDAGAALNTSSL